MNKSITTFEIRDIHPRIAKLERPFFIVQLETAEGPIKLKFQKSAQEFFADKIEHELGYRA